MSYNWTYLLFLLMFFEVSEAAVGTSCTSDADCVTTKETCDTDFTYKCHCSSGYFSDGAECNLRKSYDVSCSKSPENCLTMKGLNCRTTDSGDKCSCSAEKYWKTGDSCQNRHTYNQACQASPDSCGTDLTCSSGNQCRCTDSTKYWNHANTACEARKSYDVSCSKSIENCLTMKELYCRTIDSGDKCSCSAEKYWKTGDSCQDRHTYNQACQVTPNSCGTDLTCSSASGNKCRCTDRNKYWNTVNTACEAKIDLSVPCSKSDTIPCKDTNAECINNDAGTGTVCRCKDTYFDDNAFSNSGGTCKPMSELKTTLSTENVKTTDITVKWTEPALSSQIDSFEVSWTAGGAAGSGSPKDVGKVYTTIISGLTSGEEYTFNVKSKEKGSRNSEQTVTSDDHKDRTFPAMPGELTSSVYDTPDITVTWTASTGVVHTYSIKVTRASDNYVLGSKVVNSPTLTATFSSAVPGTRYNVEIIAKSESSNQRQSEPRQAVIRTTTTEKNVGGNCTANVQCGVVDSECAAGKCACKSTHYEESSTSCKPRKSYDAICSKSPETCLTIKGLNCRTTGSGDKCICSAENYWKTGDRCQDRHTYNQACQVTPNSCGTDLTCNSAAGDKCRCTDSSMYWNTANTACQTKIDLSVTCSKSDTTPCKDTNSECINNDAGTGTVCRCKDTYFDDNGFSNSGGTCKSMSELKTTVRTENVKTTDITVKWTEPALSSQIDSFEVSWRWTVGSAAGTGSPKNVGKVYTKVISGLTPGAEYTFNVKSKEKGSRNSEQTVMSDDHKDRTFPVMPGNLTSSVYDAPDITITWNASAGVVHTYSIKVTRASDNSVLDSRVVNQVTLTSTFSSAISGTRYNVEIVAKSESSNQRQSEARQTVIRTTTIKPNPPTHLVCNPMDKELTLSWTPPSFPNGDIQHYLVTYNIKGNVTSTTMTTPDSTPSKLIDNLNPATDYELKIRTMNDKFTSVYSTVKDCRTKDGLPEKPTDFKSTGKSSNFITLSWGIPIVPNGEIFAYRLTVANGTECLHEILFTCRSGCSNSQHVEFNGSCGSQIEVKKPIEELHQLITYTVTGLSSFVNYSLALSGIGKAGDGYRSMLTIETDETAPSKISSLSAMVVSATEVKVSWEINGPRPGITTYTIYVFDRYNKRNDLVKTETVTGFYKRSHLVTRLQEFWRYSFSIKAHTSIGSTFPVQTTVVSTKMTEPGVVDAFVAKRPDMIDLTQVAVSWQLPKIEDRNGVIKIYKFDHNASGSAVSININVPSKETGKYEMIFNVIPDMQYYFKVTAINSEGTEGLPHIKMYYAPPGKELNSESEPQDQATFTAGIAMIAIGILCLLVSLVLTFYSFRRWRIHEQSKGTSQRSKTQFDASLEQGDSAYAEVDQSRSNVYEVLGEKDKPSVYDRVDNNTNRARYMNTAFN